MKINAEGRPELPSTTIEETPYYMEAEVNSPMAVLGPGETYAFDTQWFPTRTDSELTAMTEAGVIDHPLSVRRQGDGLKFSGSFGAFFPGQLKAFLYDHGGLERGETSLGPVQPQNPIVLNQTIPAAKNIARVSLHLIDTTGVDHGALGEVFVTMDHEDR
jgi:hypothetical protein